MLSVHIVTYNMIKLKLASAFIAAVTVSLPLNALALLNLPASGSSSSTARTSPAGRRRSGLRAGRQLRRHVPRRGRRAQGALRQVRRPVRRPLRPPVLQEAVLATTSCASSTASSASRPTGGPAWALRNSGVMIHGQTPETMRKDQDFPVSIEVQFLGGDGNDPRTTGNLCTPGTNVVYEGKLSRRTAPTARRDTFHGDQWVTVEIEVHGNKAHPAQDQRQDRARIQRAAARRARRRRQATARRAAAEDDHRRHDLAAIREPPRRVPQGRAAQARRVTLAPMAR